MEDSESSSTPSFYDFSGDEIIAKKYLFGVIENLQETERTIADNWIKWYKDNNIEAFAELLQLFISTLGYKHMIMLPVDKALMHKAFEKELIIMELSFLNGQNYLLCRDDMQLYRDKYCNSLKKIVVLSQEYVLYDDFFMKNVTDFLKLLSESSIVEHQHLAIITALSLFTPLTRVEFNLRNLELSDIDKLKYVEGVMRDLYDGIIGQFMLSESDDVFRSCLTALRQWINYDHYGFRYCSKPHLSHLLEATSHSDRTVRLSAIRTIHKLYKTCADEIEPDDNKLKSLEEFSKDSRHELLKLCQMDIPRIGCVAIDIIILADRLFPGVFLDSDLKSICRLVFVKSQDLSRAAGSLLWYYISKKHTNTEIMSLIMFYHAHKSPNWDTGTLIDALWKQITKEVFEKMVSLLETMLRAEFNLLDLVPQLGSIDNAEETIEHEDLEILVEILFEMILSYVRQATSGETKRDRHKKKVFTDLHMLEMKLKKEHLTETLIEKIVLFINSSFDYNVRCVTMALEILRHFDFKLYIGKENLLEELIVTLSRSLDEQKDHLIVHECIHCIITLRQADLDDKFPILTSLDDDLVGAYESFVEYWQTAADMEFSNFLGEILVNPEFVIELQTSKISSLIRYVPLDCGLQIDQMINIIVMFVAEYEPDHSSQFVSFFKDCLSIQYYYLTRQLNLLLPEHNAASRVLYRLNDLDKNRLDIFLGVLFQIMAAAQMQWGLRILAFEQLCDLFIICKLCSDMARTDFILLREYESQLHGFWLFVENAVFTSLLDNLEELSVLQKRRILIFYFELIWKNIIPYEYFKLVTRNIRDQPELKEIVNEMLKSFDSIQKYNPHVKITRKLF